MGCHLKVHQLTCFLSGVFSLAFGNSNRIPLKTLMLWFLFIFCSLCHWPTVIHVPLAVLSHLKGNIMSNLYLLISPPKRLLAEETPYFISHLIVWASFPNIEYKGSKWIENEFDVWIKELCVVLHYKISSPSHYSHWLRILVTSIIIVIISRLKIKVCVCHPLVSFTWSMWIVFLDQRL